MKSRVQETEYRIQNKKQESFGLFWILDSGFWILVFSCLLSPVSCLLLLCCISDAQADDARPFASLRRETYRVAAGLYRVGTPVPAWDSRDSLTVSSGTRWRRIRSFASAGTAYALCVDVETLRSFVVREGDLGNGEDDPEIPEACRLGEGASPGASPSGETPYERALRRYARKPMTGGDTDGVVLTVDLCPSRRVWDRDLFEALRGMGDGDRPLPVAVCVSGAWMRRHGEAFEQIRAWDREGALRVTFVNHSDTHPVGDGRDFLNGDGVDFEAEVLNAEAALLERGAVPSVFFRFPGLVHSPARLKALAGYGLIPVDADHWPGQGGGDRPPEGILLLHGNGNERAGVRWFLEMAERTGLKEKLRAGTRRALSLMDCLRDE